MRIRDSGCQLLHLLEAPHGIIMSGIIISTIIIIVIVIITMIGISITF